MASVIPISSAVPPPPEAPDYSLRAASLRESVRALMVAVHQISPGLAEQHVAQMTELELEDRRAMYEAQLLPEPPSFPIMPLAVNVEWMRYCDDCDREVRMVLDRACKLGLIGYCSGCRKRAQERGDLDWWRAGERIVPRTHTEAA